MSAPLHKVVVKHLLAGVCIAWSAWGMAQYQGTASVTQGVATTVVTSLYTCPNSRIPGTGTITANDNTTWTVPAVVDFADAAFPFASVLHNPCTGATYANAGDALAALDGSDVVEVDPNGDLITGFIFADNYFQLWVNGVPVGKDDVPYTQFNSNIVRFRVNRPFTLAMLLVDWEEHLGIGTEANGGFSHHPGDGGVVVVLKDDQGQIIATSGADWRAQVYYTAPVMDLTCPQEVGAQRLSSVCSTQDSNDGSAYYALHWPRPADWTSPSFDDTAWPQATTYTNAQVGVNNKPAYTNFTDIFDDPVHDAAFIWSTNLVLDNEVLVRHTVDIDAAVVDPTRPARPFRLVRAGAEGLWTLELTGELRADAIERVQVRDVTGRLVLDRSGYPPLLDLSALGPGPLVLHVRWHDGAASLSFMP